MSCFVIFANGLSFKNFESQSRLLILLSAVDVLMLCSVCSARMWSHIVAVFLLPFLAHAFSLELMTFLEKSQLLSRQAGLVTHGLVLLLFWLVFLVLVMLLLWWHR
jgi:hypothetical protein